MTKIKDFKPGDFVRVAPYTDSFMQGFGSGTVVAVGHKWVTVAWFYDPNKKRKFAPELLELNDVVSGSV